MHDAISNTSPLLFLHRIDALEWLPELFSEILVPTAVNEELRYAQEQGYDVPKVSTFPWLQIVDPLSIPSEWLSTDLGKGELAALALGLENTNRIIILDDALARRIGKAAGLEVWGTLRILLEAKQQKLIESVEPFINRLDHAGMWLSGEIRQRILSLAGEKIRNL